MPDTGEKAPEVTTPSWTGTPFDGVVEKVLGNYERRRQARDRQFKYFGHSPQGDDRTVVQYVNDCELRFNAYKLKPAWKEDWQANYVDPVTHDKVIAIIARLAGQPYKAEFQAKNDRFITSAHRAQVFEDINDYNETVLSNREKDNFLRLLEAAVKGTVIVFEDYENWEVKQTVVQRYDAVTGKMRSEEKTNIEGGLVSEVVPIDEFFPDNVWEIEMRRQQGATWVQRMHVDEFKRKFGKWPNAQHVVDKVSARMAMPVDGQDPAFKTMDRAFDDMVDVIRDFDASENLYLIVADGIPLTKADNPMRWKPGRLPFAHSGFEPFSTKFFFYRSLVHKLEGNQDAIDALFNMFLDKTMLSVLRPLVVGEMNDEADDPYGPGGILHAKDVSQVKELDIQEPGGAVLQALNKMQGSIEQSSVDAVSGGQAGGDAKTATEVERAQQAAREVLSLFRRCMNWLEKERGELRAYNIATYYVRPSEIRKSLGEDGLERFETAFRSFIIPETKVLTDRGMETGTKVLEMKPTRSDMDPANELKARNGLIRGPSEIVQLTPDYLRDFDMDIKVVEVPSFVLTTGMQKVMDERFATIALGRPELFDQVLVAKRLAKAYNQDENVVVEQGEQGMMPEEGGAQPMPKMDERATLAPIGSAL